MKYYSLNRILKENADYNIIIGERSNGKTYASLKYCLENYLKSKKSFVYLRRWKEDLTVKRMSILFSAFNVSKITKGEFNKIVYKNGGFYFANEINDKIILDSKKFCYCVSLSDMEHDKSVNYENVTSIIFDEFLTRSVYIRDEFIIFMNVISTVIRNKDNVKIFMLGNTVNNYSPYFDEMGLNNIKNQNQGTIDLYKYSNSSLTVAVEYCENLSQSKKSNKYFAFDNPRLEMIKGGKWEIGNYRHLPNDYRLFDKDIVFTFAISFNGDYVRCDIYNSNDDVFLYITKKTTEIKENMLSYDLNNNSISCYRRNNLVIDNLPISCKIRVLFNNSKVFYMNNKIGELVNNYIKSCKQK